MLHLMKNVLRRKKEDRSLSNTVSFERNGNHDINGRVFVYFVTKIVQLADQNAPTKLRKQIPTQPCVENAWPVIVNTGGPPLPRKRTPTKKHNHG